MTPYDYKPKNPYVWDCQLSKILSRVVGYYRHDMMAKPDEKYDLIVDYDPSERSIDYRESSIEIWGAY